MKRLATSLLVAASLFIAGCGTSPFPESPDPERRSAGGVVGVEANAAVHHVYPMLESIIIEYDGEVLLPNQAPGELYSFDDTEGGQSSRVVTDVYTNDQARVRDDRTSVPGRFVILQLDRVENPQPQNSGPWRPASTAGSTVLRDGREAFRTDYSGLDIHQRFDASDANGRIIQPEATLPDLARENVHWPEFAGFSIDNVLAGQQGDIHYSFYLPPDYDPASRYPLMVALPGYGGLLHSLDEETRGINVFTDRNALAWTQAGEDVIVLAPQLTGWDQQSAEQTIELTEHFLDQYAIDRNRVYALGFSGGGETMSRVLNTRADLFAAYVHVSSQWNGTYDDVVENRMPVYIFMAESDEYYGAQKARDVRDALTGRYATAGLGSEEIDRLVVLDLPDDSYFNRYGITYYHGGGAVAAEKPAIIRWVLNQRKQ
jgi:predicted peptidase